MKLLHIDSGLFEQAVSRNLSAQIVAHLAGNHADLQVTRRDLISTSPGHLSADVLAGFGPAQADRSATQQAEAELTQTLLDEFLAADIVVIGAPMYNFGIPSQLKAWFDRVLQAGKTFRYTAEGPVGLAGGKQVYIASARGGFYSTSEGGRLLDFQEDYLRTLLGFIGITDVQIVRAEGIALGEEAKAQAIAAAETAIGAL